MTKPLKTPVEIATERFNLIAPLVRCASSALEI